MSWKEDAVNVYREPPNEIEILKDKLSTTIELSRKLANHNHDYAQRLEAAEAREKMIAEIVNLVRETRNCPRWDSLRRAQLELKLEQLLAEAEVKS